MRLTSILFKKVKTKNVKVVLQSTGSDHRLISFRERTAPKKEIIRRDPYVLMDCVYKEIKKIGGVHRNIEIKKENNEHTYGIIPEN